MWENAERKENSQVRQNNNRLAIKRSRGSFSSSSRTIDNILSHNLEPFRRYWDPQQVEEVNCMLPTSTASPEPLEPKGWWCWLLETSSPTNQKNVHERITLSSLNHYHKTTHYNLRVGTHSFEGISLLWPPLPGKAIKLLFSTSS